MALQDTVAQADAANTPPPAASPPETPVAVVDHDDLEMQSALAAATAAETPLAPGTKDQPNTGTPEGNTPNAAKPDGDAPTDANAPLDTSKPGKDPIIVLRQRLNEEQAQNREKDQALARLQGENEALKSLNQRPSNTGTPLSAAPVKKPEDRLAEIDVEREKIANKFDDGTFSATEWEKARAKLDREANELRDAVLLGKVADTKAQSNGASPDDMYLDVLTDRLETEHPYVNEISDRDLTFLHDKAIQELRREGVQIPAGVLNSHDRYVVRERIAVLSDKFGPVLTGKTLEPQATATPANDGQKPHPAGLSADALARKAALERAANHPPDVNTLGHATNPGNGQVSEAQIATLSDEEITALPSSARERFRPQTR